MTDKTKIFCNNCKCDTNHQIKGTHDQVYNEEIVDNGVTYLGYYEETEYRFLVCCGCDTATLESKWTSAGMHNQKGDCVYSYDYYPQRIKHGERKVKAFHYIDNSLRDTYKEIIVAFQQGLEIVTAMGVRALLEGICVHEGIDDKVERNLAGKIARLKEQPNIPDSIIDGLRGITYLGNDAAHRLVKIEKHALELSIDLLESLMTHLYETPAELANKSRMISDLKGD